MFSAAAAYGEGYGARQPDDPEWPLWEPGAGSSSNPQAGPSSYASRARSASSRAPPSSGYQHGIGLTDYSNPPYAPGNLSLRHTRSTPSLRHTTPILKPRKSALRRMISQPMMFTAANTRTRRRISREYREIQESIEKAELNPEEYAQVLRDRAMHAVRFQQTKVNQNAGGWLIPDEIVHDACLAVCYNALHREDEALKRAIEYLKAMGKSSRDELSEFVKSVVKSSGGTRVELVVAERWEGFMKHVLGNLAVGWTPSVTLHSELMRWSSEERKWEMRKFIGVVWYALKIFEGQIDRTDKCEAASAETIPDYAVRIGGDQNEIPADVTILCPYFTERKTVRNQIRRYLNQLFEPGRWERIAPLLWLVNVSNALPSVRGPDEYQTKLSLDLDETDVESLGGEGTPKVDSGARIVMVQLGRAEFAIYRVFEEPEDEEYQYFRWSIRRMDEPRPARVNNKDLMEFFRVGDAWEDEGQRRVKWKVGEVGRTGAWLGVSEVVDGLPDRGEEDSVFRGFSGEFTDEARAGGFNIERGRPRLSEMTPAEIRMSGFNKQVSDGVWSYFGYRVFDVKYEPESKTLDFLDSALAPQDPRWIDFGLPSNWQQGYIPLPWEAAYREIQDMDSEIAITRNIDEVAKMITPMWKQVLLRKVERDRESMIKGLWGDKTGGRKLKGLKKRGAGWYGNLNFGGSNKFKRFGGIFGGKKEGGFVEKKERMRIKAVAVLGFESSDCWDDEVWEKERFRRVFE
ncbi:hypothetical protein TWF679_010959 [Orbilia oligospora]|uniref:Uncharacterized protein n=1 Tax=Orbilia oligospora TaxID=2813651 RepID=A0A8H8VIK4_ORBOL|nr:hypothetical protein TWF679_010959 [Orbilia oligospora]